MVQSSAVVSEEQDGQAGVSEEFPAEFSRREGEWRDSRLSELIRIVSALCLIAVAANILFAFVAVWFLTEGLGTTTVHGALWREVGVLIVMTASLLSVIGVGLASQSLLLAGVGALPLFLLALIPIVGEESGFVFSVIVLSVAVLLRLLFLSRQFSYRSLLSFPGRETPSSPEVLLLPGSEVQHEVVLSSGVLAVDEPRFSLRMFRAVKGAGERLSAGSRVVRGRGDGQVLVDEVPRWEMHALRLAQKWFFSSVGNEREILLLLGGGVIVGGIVAITLHDLGFVWPHILTGAAAPLLGVFAGWSVLLWFRSPVILAALAFRAGVLVHDRDALRHLVTTTWWRGEGEEQLSITSLEVCDDTLSRKQLLALLFSATSHDESPLAQAIARFAITGEIAEGDLLLEQIEDYRSFPEQEGFTLTIRGSEVTIGPESFLVYRGVHVPVNLGGRSGNRELLVAIGPHVVAILRVARPLTIPPGMRCELQMVAEARARDLTLRGDGDLQVRAFDPILCEYRGEGITLLDGGISDFVALVDEIRARMRSLRSAGVAGVLTVVWSITTPFLFTPLVVLLGLIVGLIAVVVSLSCYRAAPIFAPSPS